MGTDVRARTRTSRRTVALAVGASLLVVLFVAGLAFTNSVGAEQVADNAHSLHWTNSTLGTAALSRAGLVQATTFVELEAEGLATADDVAYAMQQVESSSAELERLEGLGERGSSTPFVTSYLRSVRATTAALQVGDAERARDLVLGEVETSYQELVDSLERDQQVVLAAIDENTKVASRLNGYVLFFTMLAVPASAVFVYWLIARRQMRELRVKTELELEAEREISRAKDDFIAGLSHELRTPLTSIYGFAEVLADGAIDDPHRAADTAQIIADEAAEMTRMVDDLLTASRLESTGIAMEMAPTPVAGVVEAAVTPLERAGVEIERQPTDAVASVDGGRLRHVLTNLLSNARRHGGPTIGIDVSRGEETVEIEVWDDGPGVPEDQTEKLFERFVHDGGGPLLTGSVGLGLAIASRLTVMMGGKLSYQRHLGKTYFTVSLQDAAGRVEEAGDEAGDDEEDSVSVAEIIRTLST